MKILHLTLKKKWFDMIASGKKKEEYREVKQYWINRLTWHEFHKCDYLQLLHYAIESDVYRHDFDSVCFHNGYAKNSPAVTVALKEVFIGRGNIEWGAIPDEKYFVIKLGNIIN